MENELFNSLLDRSAHRGCAAVLRAPKRKFHTGVGDLLDRSILQQIRGTQSHNSRVVVCSAFDDAEIFGGGKGI